MKSDLKDHSKIIHLYYLLHVETTNLLTTELFFLKERPAN